MGTLFGGTGGLAEANPTVSSHRRGTVAEEGISPDLSTRKGRKVANLA
ncbi:MAG: hypothetical protein AB3N33_01730 [Puniceicoccaceae bacterium]